jgi:argininosuccinate lyase
MLQEVGLLTEDEKSQIIDGLNTILTEIEKDKFDWSLDLEDVHMNIEARLVAMIGDAGKKLHTGRSRNDQVATDIRLYLREQLDKINDEIKRLQVALLNLALLATLWRVQLSLECHKGREFYRKIPKRQKF